MGGVDLLDSLIGRYKFKMRCHKWYIRIFYHILDITIINARLMYPRSNKGRDVKNLADFRIELAITLCNIGPSVTHKRGRPSDTQRKIDLKRKKTNVTPLPP